MLAVLAGVVCACGDSSGDDLDAAAHDASAVDASGPDADQEMPVSLRDTGLYADFEAGTLAEGVLEFQPQYVLWTDEATKRRWVQLPDGEQIDTSDMDFWNYPVGTKLWKEFTRDGIRVETRLLQKNGPLQFDWYMMAFAWNADQTEAEAVPFGATNVLGTNHDIPSRSECRQCHEAMPDISLGFTAIMLDHDLGGVTLAQLVTDNRLTDPPGGSAPYYPVPGAGTPAQPALGYLHANCGGCHHAQSPVQDVVGVQFRLVVDALAQVEDTPTYKTTVNRDQMRFAQGADKIIVPMSPLTSSVHVRMNDRESLAMPPLGTEDVDTEGLAAVDAWINVLPE